MRRLAPYLPALIAPLCLFAPFLLGQQVLYWGTPLLQFYPWRALMLALVQQGHWPLWNPYLGNGAPLLANYQTAVFYPPNWLAFCLPLDYAQSWLAVLHLMWAGVGMVCLARAWGLQPLGQALAGLAFGLSQYLVARVGFFSINAAVAWLPWVVLYSHHLAQSLISNLQSPIQQTGPISNLQSDGLAQSLISSPPFNFLLLALILALQLLAGHAQTTWYTLLLAGAWLLWRGAWGLWVEKNLAWPQFAKALVLFGAAGLLAAGLAAVQLLPTAELMRQSSRATAADYDFVMTYSFSPWRLLTLLAPDLLGHPATRYYGYGNYWEDAVYVGVLPLLLTIGMVCAALVRRAPKSPVVPFLLLLIPLTLLLALGKNTPVFPFFYRFIPTFNLFQAPTRLMVLVVFALALLAGWGADHWQPPQKWALYWTRLGAAGAVSVTLIGAAGWWWTRTSLTAFGQQLHTVAQAVMVLGLLLFCAAIFSLLKPSTAGRPLRVWQIAVITFLVLDLIFFNFALNPGAAPTLYTQPTQSAAFLRPALQTHRLFQFPHDEYLLKFRRYLSFKTFGPPALAPLTRAAQLPNLALLEDLPSANNFDPLLSARYTGLLDVISATRSTALLNLMDVAIVGSVQPLAWPVVGKADTTTFYRVPGVAERVRIVYQSQQVADLAAALTLIADPQFDPAQSVILEPAPLAGWPAPDPVFRPAEWQRPAPGAVTMTVTLTQTGWVVLADTHYPGWVAWVDEQPAPILPANAAFRALAVPAGTHRLAFAYRPVSFNVGLWITVIALLVWITIICCQWFLAQSKRKFFG